MYIPIRSSADTTFYRVISRGKYSNNIYYRYGRRVNRTRLVGTYTVYYYICIVWSENDRRSTTVKKDRVRLKYRINVITVYLYSYNIQYH